MSNLILDSLEICNSRGFRELRIAKLGRANLITGMNNIGKTSILEALRIYAQPGASEVLLDLLEERNETSMRYGRPGITARSKLRDLRPVPIECLFHGRNIITGAAGQMRIGPLNAIEKTLIIELVWHKLIRDPETGEPRIDIGREEDQGRELGLQFEIGGFKRFQSTTNLSQLSRSARASLVHSSASRLHRIPLFFVGSNGLGSQQIGTLWDSIALSQLEEEVIAALKIISPEIDRLILISEDEYSRVRTPVVKSMNFDQPIPLKSMGDGVNRLFGMILALVNAKDGILLIDEIENGIHYSVQTDVWRLFFQTARRLNVQVFSTTHSWDCIKAFQKAAEEDEESEGVLIRLARKGDQIRVAELDEKDLRIAVEGKIEVR